MNLRYATYVTSMTNEYNYDGMCLLGKIITDMRHIIAILIRNTSIEIKTKFIISLNGF